VLVVWVQPAAAFDPPPTPPSASGSAGPGGAQTQVGIPGSPNGGSPASPSGGGASSGCPGGYTYLPTVFDGNLGQPYPGAPGQAIDVYCGGTYVNTVWQGPGQGPTAPQVNPAQLAQQALASAAFQQLGVVMSPPSGREAVNFPIFLSLSSGYAPVTASASAGGVTSTVSIVPGSVTWAMGDGGSVTCQGPGVPLDPSRPFAAQLPPPCGYRYQRSSANEPGQAFQVTATVHYNATWTVTGAAGGGSLGPVDRSISVPVTVGEIQVVNS
jgi:hypothetical protein